MPYITPPPVLPSDVGTDFLLDIDIDDEQENEEKEDSCQ